MKFKGVTLDRIQVLKIGGFFGLAAVVVYLLATFAAATQFPVPYSPFTNWISDLGDYGMNPQGAIIYNVGSAIAGILFVPFFFSLASWTNLAKSHKYEFYAIELFGLFIGFCLLMLAVFPEGTSLHSFWSTVCFGVIAIGLTVINYMLLKNPKFNRLIAYYGLAAGLFGLLFFAGMIGFYVFNLLENPPNILEWIVAYAGLLWATLAAFNVLGA